VNFSSVDDNPLALRTVFGRTYIRARTHRLTIKRSAGLKVIRIPLTRIFSVSLSLCRKNTQKYADILCGLWRQRGAIRFFSKLCNIGVESNGRQCNYYSCGSFCNKSNVVTDTVITPWNCGIGYYYYLIRPCTRHNFIFAILYRIHLPVRRRHTFYRILKHTHQAGLR